MKKHVKCLWCLSLNTKRSGKRKIAKRWIQRFYCRQCGHIFSFRHSPGKLSWFEKVNLTRTHLEGRSSYRTIARHTGHSKTTVCKVVNEVIAKCPAPTWIAEKFKPKWTGYLALDGKSIRVWDWSAKHFDYTQAERRWLHKLCLLLAMDLGTLDLPYHDLDEEETAIDLILLLRGLKELNYPLKGYVSDGNPDIPKAVKKVFGPNVPHQLCVRHFLQNLRVKMNDPEYPLTNENYRRICHIVLTGQETRDPTLPKELFTYRHFPALPRTNQQIENCFRYFSLRLKTINMFQNIQTAKNYLNALVLQRRFTAFTDSKYLKGKSPLELAGCDVRKIDYLKLK
jgi:transposase-like protein